MAGSPLRRAGGATLGFLADVGGIWRLGAAATGRLVLGPLRGERFRLQPALTQALRAGYGSLPLVALICLLVGMIMALQSAYQLAQLGAIELVADLVALAIARELAPLLTAVIVAGRYGSAIAAELGTMRVSQEIDALEVMGIDPIAFLVVPRLLALTVTLPCLTVFADVIGILGGWLIGVGVLDLGRQAYLARTVDALALQDVFTGLVKSLAFAAIIGYVGCFQGLRTHGGAQEVGRATTSAVVRSIVLIVAADLLVTALFFIRG